MELEEAEKAPRHSRSLYRALVDNPTYEVCRCDAEGNFLEVNEALSTMLGYESKRELLAANRASDSIWSGLRFTTLRG
jgi:PAS domain S-box-containing protein